MFVDDLIVFSTSQQEHIDKLREVFQRLRDANFNIQLDKSEFLWKEVSYLGDVVIPDCVMRNPDKNKTIRNFPLPPKK